MMVIDATAMAKLVLEEDGSGHAREIFRRELAARERILAPSLVLPESLNVLWKRHILKKELTHSEYMSAVDDVVSIFAKLEKVNDVRVARLASQLGAAHKAPIYDSFYLASCIMENAPLLTFDGPMKKRADLAKIITL